MIRIAKKEDLPKILDITKACANHLISQNIYQWNDSYPSQKAFLNDISRNELYVFTENTKIVGCIVVSSLMDEEYKDVSWLTPTTHHFYIHRVAVHPDFQGNGIARALMDFAETKAQNEEQCSIRLDTFSLNKRNITFYKKRGYKQVGEVYFKNQSDAPFYCFELLL